MLFRSRLRSTAFYLFLLPALSYGLLTILAKLNAVDGDRTVLKLCRQSAGYRCVLFTGFFLSSLMAYRYAYVWIRPDMLTLGYLVLSYHQDRVLKVINRQRKP